MPTGVPIPNYQVGKHTYSNTTQPERVVVMYLGMCMYIRMSTINEKRAPELESKQGGVYGGLEEFGEKKGGGKLYH